MVDIYKQEEANFTSQYVVRAAQDYHNAKISAQENQLKKSSMKLTLVSALVLLSTLAIIIITYLYRRNRAAYKALAQKVQQWASDDTLPANNSFTNVQEEDKTKPKKITQEDQNIMERVNQEMTEKYAYREAGLTAEMLADRLGIHRNALSRAVNGIYGANFNQYVNAFRIKEAVRIMTNSSHKSLYIDELYEQVGFSNRTSFYRAFKQITGISPREFQNNG